MITTIADTTLDLTNWNSMHIIEALFTAIICANTIVTIATIVTMKSFVYTRNPAFRTALDTAVVLAPLFGGQLMVDRRRGQ